MIEISAGILALVSVGIFAAHALDAYRANQACEDRIKPDFGLRAAGAALAAFVRGRRTAAALCPVEIHGLRIGDP